MPRDLPVGNGAVLVNFDTDYNLRDFYFPHVGQENHTAGNVSRFGVWVDGHMAWMGDGWALDMRYEPGSLVTRVVARHAELGIELECADCCDFHLWAYLKEVTVRNLADRDREIRVFFHQDFSIHGNDIGDTAYYDPRTFSIIHYKVDRYFLINCCTDEKCGIDYWATGRKRMGDSEGTWRDAEDGSLGGNPIAQGSVDSVVGFSLPTPAGGSRTLHYWIACQTDYPSVARLNRVIWDLKPEALFHRTRHYWQRWLDKGGTPVEGVPDELVDLYQRSLLIIRTQCDNDGAILAANDFDISHFGSDTYSYMWPRDGALVVDALSRAGRRTLVRRFFDFCRDVVEPEGYFVHKYNPDKTVASTWHPWIVDNETVLPIQEDETALVLWALGRDFERRPEVETLKPLFRRVVTNGADFLLRHRDERTGLPKPSWDLWEERLGVHAFTVAAVIGGLEAAAGLVEQFGDARRAEAYRTAAARMRTAMKQYLWHHDKSSFIRRVVFEHGQAVQEPVIDASNFAVWAFGAFAPDSPESRGTMDAIRRELTVNTAVGGIARYPGDYYHRVTDEPGVPGNPWFISTLWAAQYEMAVAKTRADLESPLRTLHWVRDHALPSGVLAEQVHPFTNAPLSVSPLTWSHATYVSAILDYAEALKRVD